MIRLGYLFVRLVINQRARRPLPNPHVRSPSMATLRPTARNQLGLLSMQNNNYVGQQQASHNLEQRLPSRRGGTTF